MTFRTFVQIDIVTVKENIGKLNLWEVSKTTIHY